MISFVIPAHNEEALIGRTLLALHAVAKVLDEPYEAIVANDSSTDRTGEIAHQHGARVVPLNRRQIAASRNAGAQAARGETLIFVDADTMVTPQAVRGAMRVLRRGVVGGGCLARFDGPVPLYAEALLLALRVFSPALGLAPGCFLFCTRRAYLAAGGFDESLFAAEEVAFASRLKRQGHFLILHDFVITSGRKVRAYGALDLLRLGVKLALGGPQSLQRREGLELWYGPREAAS